jgi:hypothetical protein
MKIEDIFPLGNVWAGAFEKMEWADDEIDKARARHGETDRGPLWHSFLTVCQNEPYMADEIIYRAHAREILERVAAGHDVRPGTDAEMIAALRDSSKTAPLSSSAVCLYFRIAARSFPDLWAKAGDHSDLTAYESVHGSAADDHESWLRAKMTRNREV